MLQFSFETESDGSETLVFRTPEDNMAVEKL